LCGLTTEEIARAFLVAPGILAQRIVRAKPTIRDKSIPFQVPSPKDLPERPGAVLHVIYLVFNKGYSASAGTEVTRAELSSEAIRFPESCALEQGADYGRRRPGGEALATHRFGPYT
jgi:RNA polymerase sigma-70 factor, ECF subfamily